MSIAALVFVLAIQTQLTDAQLCRQWADPVRIGELPSQLRESSGLAASREYPDRLYHINDSGDAGRFFVSRLDGSGLQSVAVAGFKPRDTEALSLGPCPGAARGPCIYVGDIGDNRRRRKTIQIVAIQEQKSFGATATPIARFSLHYPDGPQNAESMAIHPDGTLFILTKTHPARLHTARLNASQQTLTFVTTLDAGSAPTDMSMSDDGTRLLVLTYKDAVEFTTGFAEQRHLALRALPQQESVTYLAGSRSFLFTNERVIQLPQPIMRVDCLSPGS